MIDLSVLICSTHTRSKTFGVRIQQQVWEQYHALPEEDRERIEIIMLTDNKKMMLGHKRNVMVDMAQGRYVQFIDDDDRISPRMFRRVLDATLDDADVITFGLEVSLNGEPPKRCRYSLDYTADRDTEELYERLPNHICAVKRELAIQVSFPNIAYGEDATYAKLLRPLLRSEHAIDEVLYFYDYVTQTSETQQHRPAPVRLRPNVPPLVDVVMVSKASTDWLRYMTQTAIDTCLAGANGLPVSVTVMEGAPGVRHERARTVAVTDEFNYNRFLNRGAAMGFAPWIVMANNDLVFHDGWLHHLLAANHEVVSPKCPRDPRQTHITEPQAGYQLIEHLSGWCFMLSRELWRRIGGLCEDMTFFCSDDVFLEQLKAIEVPAMLVPAAEVEHVQSATVRDESPQRIEELLWPNVALFNDTYGDHKFENDERFILWRKKHQLA